MRGMIYTSLISHIFYRIVGVEFKDGSALRWKPAGHEGTSDANTPHYLA